MTLNHLGVLNSQIWTFHFYDHVSPNISPVRSCNSVMQINRKNVKRCWRIWKKWVFNVCVNRSVLGVSVCTGWKLSKQRAGCRQECCPMSALRLNRGLSRKAQTETDCSLFWPHQFIACQFVDDLFIVVLLKPWAAGSSSLWFADDI